MISNAIAGFSALISSSASLTSVPELEKISGVAQVEVSGGSEDYIKVELNETLLNQYGLTMDSIAQHPPHRSGRSRHPL